MLIVSVSIFNSVQQFLFEVSFRGGSVCALRHPPSVLVVTRSGNAPPSRGIPLELRGTESVGLNGGSGGPLPPVPSPILFGGVSEGFSGRRWDSAFRGFCGAVHAVGPAGPPLYPCGLLWLLGFGFDFVSVNSLGEGGFA